jgi:hydrogenase expression/formation protein HypE
MIMVVPPESVKLALETLQKHPLGKDACLIGEVRKEPGGMVFMRTEIGGSRVLDMLVGDPLPRIC